MDTRCPECEPVVLRTRNSGRLESRSMFERIGTQGASAPLKRQVRWEVGRVAGPAREDVGLASALVPRGR